MGAVQDIFQRAELLLGAEAMERISRARVIVFGVGGVGSWCVESLVRSGVRHITIVDSDRVSMTNVNRQLMATVHTVGQVKVEALKERLLTLNPEVEVDARQQVFTEETADSFHLDDYDYIIDAIDSLKDKVLLIERACRTHARFYSSMGAALKLDPTRIQVAEFWKVQGCPLARALRQRFKKLKRRPARKFPCVYSDELLENKGQPVPVAGHRTDGDGTAAPAFPEGGQDARKAQINGSLMHITAIFGLTLAGLALQDMAAGRG